MMRLGKPVAALAIVAAGMTAAPTQAEARTKSIVKYGAIGLGAAAIYNMGQRSAYGGGYYGHYPAYRAYPAYHHHVSYVPVVHRHYYGPRCWW